MSIVYRQELGRELTWSEADNNFAELKAGVDSKKSNFDVLPVTQGGTGQTTVDAVKVAFDIATKTELADSGGAALVGYDDGSLQDIADAAKTMQSYTALRAYTGRATSVRITTPGVAGIFYRDDADTTTADNGGTVLVDASGRRWKRVYSDALNVKWFGAKGDGVTDDTTAIKAAITAASSAVSVQSVVFFPAGLYRITSSLNIDRSGLELRGENSYGTYAYSPLGISGSHIAYDANDGGDIIVFGANASYRYRNRISHLRVGAHPGLTTKPNAAVTFNACSEAAVIDLNTNGGCVVGLRFNACTLTEVNELYSTLNDVGVLFDVNTSVAGATANVANWLRNLNIYNCADGVLFTGSARNINFRDSWIEYAARTFHFRQDSAAILDISDIQLDNVYGSVGGSGPADSRFIKATPLADASQYMRVGIKARNCTAYNSGSNYNVEFVKGTNTGENTYLDQAVFDNCTFFGASAAAVYSDTANSSATFTGRTIATSGFNSGSVIPLVAGSARLHKFATENGYIDMVGSLPIRLPTIDALSYATNGQFYFQSDRYRLAFTANGNRILMSRPLVATYADEAVSVNVKDSAETLRFNTPLTADRLVTLSTTNAYNGAKFRVFRTAAATGAFNLSVGGLKNLAVGQWCDVEHDGTAWRLTAAGSL